jgi:hypothetical protein
MHGLLLGAKSVGRVLLVKDVIEKVELKNGTGGGAGCIGHSY